MVQLSLLLQTGLLGLQLGITLVLITLGLTLIFGMMDVINIAHGSLFMLGAYFGLSLVQYTGSFWVALVGAPLVVGVLALLIEVFGIRPLYGRDPLYHVLLTFGMVLLLQGAVEGIWGTDTQAIAAPPILSGSFVVGPLVYPAIRVFILLVGLVLVVGVWLVFQRTNIGIVMRGMGEDAEMVDALGIDVSKVYTGVFIFGSVLAGLAGVLLGTSRAISPTMGTDIIIQAFAIIVIGGIGSFRGAVVAAILVGLLNAYGALFIPSYVEVLVFVLMALVLIVKPTGMFGSREVA